MMMCPNCDEFMCVGENCRHCDHKDRDPECKCDYCLKRKSKSNQEESDKDA